MTAGHAANSHVPRLGMWFVLFAPVLARLIYGPPRPQACYHSKTGAVELYLNHLVDTEDEYVVVDMTAGADCFASGLFTRFDLTFLVAEPTVRGVSVWRQYRDYADGYDVALAVIGNKVTGGEDVDFLRERVGDDLLACFGTSAYVRAAEQGSMAALDALEPDNRDVLAALHRTVDTRAKNWTLFQEQAVDFHRRNAVAWANKVAGTDLTAQVDPEFVHGRLARPGLLPRLYVRARPPMVPAGRA